MDRETVITHLQIIHTWAEFARERDLQFFTPKHLEDIAQWSDDAIELLKEQDAEKEKMPEYPCKNCCSPSERAACCGCEKERQWQTKYGKRSVMQGRSVKWDA